MAQIKLSVWVLGMVLISSMLTSSQVPEVGHKLHLADIRMRDVCILADPLTKTYYAISSGYDPRAVGYGGSFVRAFTSKDLIEWDGPKIIFQTPTDQWGDVPIT